VLSKVVLFVPLLVLVLHVWQDILVVQVPVLFVQLIVINVLLVPNVLLDTVPMVSMLMELTDVLLVLLTVSPVTLDLPALVLVLLVIL
jgi:hypothetical protein